MNEAEQQAEQEYQNGIKGINDRLVELYPEFAEQENGMPLVWPQGLKTQLAAAPAEFVLSMFDLSNMLTLTLNEHFKPPYQYLVNFHYENVGISDDGESPFDKGIYTRDVLIAGVKQGLIRFAAYAQAEGEPSSNPDEQLDKEVAELIHRLSTELEQSEILRKKAVGREQAINQLLSSVGVPDEVPEIDYTARGLTIGGHTIDRLAALLDVVNAGAEDVARWRYYRVQASSNPFALSMLLRDCTTPQSYDFAIDRGRNEYGSPVEVVRPLCHDEPTMP